MPAIPQPPTPGQLVHLGQRRYLVEETVPPTVAGDATLVGLACVDDDAQGQPLDVLWECEVDPEILKAEDWCRLGARGFDEPERFAACLHTLRWSLGSCVVRGGRVSRWPPAQSATSRSPREMVSTAAAVWVRYCEVAPP